MDESTREFVFAHLKEAYYFQIECLYKIRDRISFISGFILLLGIATTSLLGHAPSNEDTWVFLSFWGFYIISGVLFVIATSFACYCAVKGFQYAYIPGPERFWNTTKKWQSYNSHPAVSQKIDVKEKLQMELMDLYQETAEHNLGVNTTRNRLLVRSMQFAFFSGLFLAGSAICHLIAPQNETAPLPVKITETIKLERETMNEEEKESQNSPQSSSEKPQASESEPERPSLGRPIYQSEGSERSESSSRESRERDKE